MILNENVLIPKKGKVEVKLGGFAVKIIMPSAVFGLE